MINWKVFKRDDPRTYPEIDCPMLVLLNDITVVTCKWDNSSKMFYNDELVFDDGCFYAYLSHIPDTYKTHHTVHCGYVDENGDECACPYGFDDNGYCMCDDGFKCEHQVVWNEYEIIYEIITKRIWKEFE